VWGNAQNLKGVKMKKLIFVLPLLFACGEPPERNDQRSTEEGVGVTESQATSEMPIVATHHAGEYDSVEFSGMAETTYYVEGGAYFKHVGRSHIEGTLSDAMTILAFHGGLLDDPIFDEGNTFSVARLGTNQELAAQVIGCLVLEDEETPYYDSTADVVDFQVVAYDDVYKEIKYTGRWSDDLGQEIQRVQGSIIVER
jgi:hypothetical protein